MNDLSNAPRTAKLFWSGRSQAVRLPKDFRFEGSEVTIRHDGDKVILEPRPPQNGADWVERIAGTMDEDFARAVFDGRPGPEDMRDPPVFG